MYSIVRLKAHNFMSFEDVELFLLDKCYVIKGENLDNKGQQSNGSGKTSLLEVIAITLLGQSLTDRDLKSCVHRYGEENFFITSLTLTSNTEEVVIITRKVYSNTKSQELSITINDEPLKEIPTKAGIKNGVDLRKGNEWILNSLLGISKEDLLNYYLISRNDYKGFLSSGNQNKINVISRFSNATKIDKVLKGIENNIKDLEKDITSSQTIISTLKGKIEGINYTISQEAKDRFEEDKKKRKEQLLPRSKQLEEQLNGLLSSISSKEKELSSMEIFSDEQAKEIVKEKNELRQLHSEIISLIGKTKKQLLGVIECPSCHHKFIVGEDEPVEVLQSTLKQSEEDEMAIISNISDLDLVISQIGQTNAFSREIDSLVKQAQTLESTLNSLTTQINSIESENFITQDVTQKLCELEAQILEEENKIKEVFVKEQTKLKLWYERFEKFKYYLINKPISIICNKTNQMLREIDCDYSISIEGFKKLKSGELRAELTPVVHIKGLESQPYPQFSAGERTRLDLACDLSIQSMINSTSGGGLNFYMSDECISGLDSRGIESVAKSFNKLNKSILLVSHSGSDLNYDSVLTLKKENKKTILV
jgi:DNA repair exonuclease SbcCD ATPase subunit